MQLIFPGNAFDTLRIAMLSFASETCAILLAREIQGRFIVMERHIASETAYRVRDESNAQLDPEFLVPIVKHAKEQSLSVIFCHTHPNTSGYPRFSTIDDVGETHLSAFLARRIPTTRHLALVIAPDGVASRELGQILPVIVKQIGSDIKILSDHDDEFERFERWDRQVRAFGYNGQRSLRAARVAIVGCGGTGSIVAEQLAHLGVSHFLLIDPDVIEATNLNRVVGSRQENIGELKVATTKRMIQEIDPSCLVDALAGDVRDLGTANPLKTVDAIFSCTDSHSSRAIINQIAYQFVIPTFDIGVSIQAKEKLVSGITGRAQMLAPGLGCLVCGNMLDWAEVRRELQPDSVRSSDRYIVGGGEPQPAVISINSTMSSLAVTMFMAAFSGVHATARLQFYDGVIGRVRNAEIKPDPTCVVCSASGAFAKADSWPLPTRGH